MLIYNRFGLIEKVITLNKDVKKYLPRHHLDNFYIEEMLELTEEEIKPILPELLNWTKDMSKAIAQQLIPVLVKNPNALEDTIKKILDDEKKDAIWKYNIIFYVIKGFELENKKNYKETLKRIVTNPNKWEVKYEVSEIAQRVLDEIED